MVSAFTTAIYNCFLWTHSASKWIWQKNIKKIQDFTIEILPDRDEYVYCEWILSRTLTFAASPSRCLAGVGSHLKISSAGTLVSQGLSVYNFYIVFIYTLHYIYFLIYWIFIPLSNCPYSFCFILLYKAKTQLIPTKKVRHYTVMQARKSWQSSLETNSRINALLY